MANKNSILKGVKLFVLDMDGTVYLGDKLIHGSDIFIDKAREKNRDIVFFTNNASRVASYYKNKLENLGIFVEQQDIVTAGDVTAEYINVFYPGKRIYLNGTKLLEENFRENGLILVEEEPDLVVQSFDTSMTYEKIQKICDFIREGIPFLATHCDINCPTETGFMPDCGAICEMITASTGVRPKYLGKPYKETLEMVLKLKSYNAEDIAFVGDRIYTDVATAVNNGAKGFLVLTGESDLNTVKESTIKPTEVFDSLYEMSKYL